jgi:DNA-binding CsgD family transcriptional regulator
MALHEGIFEAPLWSTFLDLLRKFTGADYVTLMFRPPGRPFEQAIRLLSGDAPYSGIDELYEQRRLDPLQIGLIEGRPYTLQEWFAAAGGAATTFYRQNLESIGIAAVRVLRVREASGIDAWLTISRRHGDFTTADVSLLVSIVPMLRSVLRLHIAMDHERYAASLTAEAVRRLRFGWLVLDRYGNLLDMDDQGAAVLANSGVLSRDPTGRLRAKPEELERKIFLALNHFGENPKSRARAITLSRDPWLDMLLIPAGSITISAKVPPAAIAYVHSDSWLSADRCEQLAELFGLSPSHARLALAISRGMTLTEAASEFGVTIETARTYVKVIYAKTGARGLADLVRIVMRSVLAITPGD